MTMIWSKGRRKQTPRGVYIALLGLSVCVLVILLRAPLSSLLLRALSPILEGRLSLLSGMSSFGAQFRSNTDLESENRSLRAQLASTTVLALDRNALYAENLFLKEHFGRLASTTSVLAAVLQRPPMTPYDTLLLDVGADHHLAVGDLVSPGGSLVIGTITDVYANTSRATLLSAPGQKYEASLLLRTGDRVPLTVFGQGAGSLIAQVPVGTAVTLGDSVLFPGIISTFVGSISAVDTTMSDSFITLFLSLPVSLWNLSYVEVRSSTTHAK